MKFRTLLFYTIIFSISCSKQERDSLKPTLFHIPVVVNSNVSDTIEKELFKQEKLSGGGPIVVGKFNFQDTVDISHRNEKNELYKERKMYDNSWRDNDSLDVNGFDIIPDYDQTIYYIPLTDTSSLGLYPVFMVNSTSSRKVFLGKDSHGFGIQEALNMENYNIWRAIECQGVDFCGNGSWSIIVNPNEFIILLFPKYDGDYKTELRVRVKNGESIYVCKSFTGQINSGQFHLHPNSDLIIDAYTINNLFYGASLSPKNPKDFQ